MTPKACLKFADWRIRHDTFCEIDLGVLYGRGPWAEELQVAFPPASNQHGEGAWPIALLTVFHELASGCALLPQVRAM